jgi:hypothetical protein
MATTPEQLDSNQRRQFWENQIETWQESGLSQAEYCRRNNLRPNRMVYWRKRIVHSCDTGVSFIPLKIIPNGLVQPIRPDFSVTTPNGFKIDIGNGFNPGIFKQIIAAIQGL